MGTCFRATKKILKHQQLHMNENDYDQLLYSFIHRFYAIFLSDGGQADLKTLGVLTADRKLPGIFAKEHAASGPTKMGNFINTTKESSFTHLASTNLGFMLMEPTAQEELVKKILPDLQKKMLFNTAENKPLLTWAELEGIPLSAFEQERENNPNATSVDTF